MDRIYRILWYHARKEWKITIKQELQLYRIEGNRPAPSPTIFRYDNSRIQEESTCIYFEGVEAGISGSQPPRIIKKIKTDPTTLTLPQALAERLEFSRIFGHTLNTTAVHFDLFLDAPSIMAATALYQVEQPIDCSTQVLSEVPPESIKTELLYASSVASTLQKLESKGFVFGDIKGDNLFVQPNSTVMFFDLYAARNIKHVAAQHYICTNSLCPQNMDLSDLSRLRTLDTYMLAHVFASRLVKDFDRIMLLELVDLDWNTEKFKAHLQPFNDLDLLTNAVAARLLALLKKGLAVYSDRRFQSAAEMQQDLAQCIDMMP